MNLEAVLEGMLFIAGEDGLSYEQIINILEIDKEEVDSIIDKLKQSYNSENRGINVDYLGNKFKLVTKKEYHDYCKKLLEDEENNILSQSALETLAIVAYNEPVTRSMVDEIRGVGSAHSIRKLVSRDLIKEVGRSDLPGRPILYGVTDQFLDHFGLSSISDLPEITIEDEDDSETNLFESKYKEQ